MPNAPAGTQAKDLPAARQFERIGHRGSPNERLENTLPSFLLALEHGADAVELDVHATRDGVIVVHHNDVVGNLALAAASWRDLSNLDLGDGARMPRLQDVLKAVGSRATVYIELKGKHVEDGVIADAREHGHRYAMHSFDHDAIARVAQRAPDIPRGVLLDRGTERPVEALRRIAERTRPRDVWPHWSLVGREFMTAAGEVGCRVIPWTVNSIDIAANLKSLGVSGVCTDDVRLLANL
jgi:glycerophosphoryl diester phosphodiesterase